MHLQGRLLHAAPESGWGLRCKGSAGRAGQDGVPAPFPPPLLDPPESTPEQEEPSPRHPGQLDCTRYSPRPAARRKRRSPHFWPAPQALPVTLWAAGGQCARRPRRAGRPSRGAFSSTVARRRQPSPSCRAGSLASWRARSSRWRVGIRLEPTEDRTRAPAGPSSHSFSLPRARCTSCPSLSPCRPPQTEGHASPAGMLQK
ncbi:serine/arginine repetitive matrix protein 1-like [Macaca nemestrina]|uniref:serine/arginine repetitive matrix protein 1-like n=1 Tax=Macaca nemestrina TaxID=9545 RepID=UPI0039B89FA8